MKKYLIPIIAMFFITSVAYAAPYFRQEASIVPIDSTENIGTSTNRWDEGWFNNINISGTCTGCGSSASYPFPLTGNATSTLTQFNGGLTAFASSTIGNGTQTGGLTVSGGATTTGNAYFASNVGIGTSTPTKQFSISGSANDLLFDGTNLSVNPKNGFQLAGSVNIVPGSGTTALTIQGQTSTGLQAASIYTGSGGLRTLQIYNTGSGGHQTVFVGGTGNNFVGVGTTSPFARISIAGSAGGTTPLFAISSSTSAFATSTPFLIASNGDVSINNGADLTVNSGTLFADGTLNRVGIGDLTPNASLEIGATATDATNLFDISGTYTSTASIATGIMDMSPTINLGFDGSPVLFRTAPTIAPTVDITGTITGLTSNLLINSGANAIADINLNSATLQLGAGYSGAVDEVRGFSYTDPSDAGAGTVTNQAGLVMAELSGATHNTSILLGNANLQDGNWSILTQTDYPSAFTASTTASNNAPLAIIGPRAAIATGNSLGNFQWFTNDTNFTAAQLPMIGSIGMVAEANHTAANQPSALTFNTTATGGTATNTEKVRITGTGKMGIGTTSPWGMLSIHHPATGDANPIFVVASSTATATTTLFSIGNTGTTTIANGVNITAGCFSLNNVCVTGGGGISSVTGTYPVQSSGGATPAISLAFGTTTSNTWAGTQTFNNTTTTNATTTGTQYVTGLATPAGTFVAADPTGKFIATSTPAGGSSADYYNTGTTKAQNPPISIVAGDRVKMWYVATLSSSCVTANDLVMGFGYKLSTHAATTTAVTAGQGAGAGDRCSVAGSAMFTATTSLTIAPAVFDIASDVGADFTSVMTTVN